VKSVRILPGLTAGFKGSYALPRARLINLFIDK